MFSHSGTIGVKEMPSEARDWLGLHWRPPEEAETSLAAQSLLQLASLVICRSNPETRSRKGWLRIPL